MEPEAQFADNLRRARAAKQMSQEDLAGAAGLHATEVSRLERGTREPRLRTIVRLARGLDTTASSLLDGIQ